MSTRMRQRHLLSLYIAQRRRGAVLVQEFFAVIGLAIGVALLFASLVASTSLDGSVSQLTEQIVGHTSQIQLQSRGPSGFSETLVNLVQRLPGVATAMPVVEQPVNVRAFRGERSVELLGADPRDARDGGPLLSRFHSAALASVRDIALPASVAQAIGVQAFQSVQVQVGSRVVKDVGVGGVLEESEVGGLSQSPVALAPIAYAQALTGMHGKVSRIFVRPEHGRTRLVRSELERIAAAHHLNLGPATSDARLFAVASGPESQGELLFAVLSALVGFMLALNAMFMSTPPRRKLIALAVQAGATRIHIAQILLFDVAVLAFFGIVVGLGLGDLLSIAVFHSTPGYLSAAFPVGNQRIVSWQSILISAAAALCAAGVGVIWPLRHRLLRQTNTDEEHRGSRSRQHLAAAQLTAGVLALVATIVILVAAPQAAVVGALALVVALLCILPTIFDGIIRATAVVVDLLFDRTRPTRAGAALKLAITSLQAPPARGISLAIARIGAIAVFGTVSIGGAQSNLQRGLDGSARANDASADVWVTPAGEASILATTPFQGTDQQALEKLPGVQSVGIYRGGFLDWRDRRLWVLAQPPQSLSPVPAGQLLKGSLKTSQERIRQGGWAVLSAALANEHHLSVGERFTLPAPHPIALRVAALATNLGWPPGAIVMNSGDYARAWQSPQPSAYEIQTRPGVSPKTAAAMVKHAIGTSAGLTVETVEQRAARHYALAAQGLSRLSQIRTLILTASILATIAVMGAMLWQRRDHIARLKSLGYSRRVLRHSLAIECAAVLGIGCLLGGITGIYGEVLNSHALAIVTGFPVFFHTATLLAITSFAIFAAVGLVIVSIAGYLVVRVPTRTTSSAY